MQNIKYKLDEYMTVLTEQEKFSGSVLVAKDKKILLSKGYGMANYELSHVPGPPLSWGCNPEPTFFPQTRI